MDATIRQKLVSAAIAFDQRQSRGKHHNPYSLGHYLKAIDQIESDVDAGVSLASALYDGACDRFLSALERAVGLPLTYGGGGQDRGRPDSTRRRRTEPTPAPVVPSGSLLHLTLTGYGAGKPICGVDKQTAQADGCEFLHSQYVDHAHKYALPLCPECKRIMAEIDAELEAESA